MTLEEAIKHSEEQYEKMGNCKCGNEHNQLAKWLTELYELKRDKIIEKAEKVISEGFIPCNLGMCDIEKENKLLKSNIEKYLIPDYKHDVVPYLDCDGSGFKATTLIAPVESFGNTEIEARWLLTGALVEYFTANGKLV